MNTIQLYGHRSVLKFKLQFAHETNYIIDVKTQHFNPATGNLKAQSVIFFWGFIGVKENSVVLTIAKSTKVVRKMCEQ